MDAHKISDEIAQMEWIDRFAAPTQKWVAKAYERMGGFGVGLRNLLHGKFLGHPLHPVTVHLPIGAWTIAALLDLVASGDAGARFAADTCVVVGIVAAIPSILSGLTHWEPYGDASIRRIGGLHGLLNVCALTFYIVSCLFRAFDVRIMGLLFGFGGFGALVLSGYLGGLLVYEKRIGPNHAPEPEDEAAEDKFVAVCSASSLEEKRPLRVRVRDVDVVVVRCGQNVYALADRCAHMGASLSEGEVKDECLICPWHQSKFRLWDGEVLEGPSVFVQPTFPVQIQNGLVCVRAIRPDTADPSAYPITYGRIELL